MRIFCPAICLSRPCLSCRSSRTGTACCPVSSGPRVRASRLAPPPPASDPRGRACRAFSRTAHVPANGLVSVVGGTRRNVGLIGSPGSVRQHARAPEPHGGPRPVGDTIQESRCDAPRQPAGATGLSWQTSTPAPNRVGGPDKMGSTRPPGTPGRSQGGRCPGATIHRRAVGSPVPPDPLPGSPPGPSRPARPSGATPAGASLPACRQGRLLVTPRGRFPGPLPGRRRPSCGALRTSPAPSRCDR